MKKFLGILTVFVMFFGITTAGRVSGYSNSDGTYVAGYWRTPADDTITNNLSYRPDLTNYSSCDESELINLKSKLDRTENNVKRYIKEYEDSKDTIIERYDGKMLSSIGLQSMTEKEKLRIWDDYLSDEIKQYNQLRADYNGMKITCLYEEEIKNSTEKTPYEFEIQEAQEVSVCPDNSSDNGNGECSCNDGYVVSLQGDYCTSGEVLKSQMSSSMRNKIDTIMNQLSLNLNDNDEEMYFAFLKNYAEKGKDKSKRTIAEYLYFYTPY